MKLQPAILNVLDAAGRALSADAILAFVPQFSGELDRVKPEQQLGKVDGALSLLVELGHVKRVPNIDRGFVYTITDDGRARIR